MKRSVAKKAFTLNLAKDALKFISSQFYIEVSKIIVIKDTIVNRSLELDEKRCFLR